MGFCSAILIGTRGHGPRSSHSLWNFENLKKNDTFGPLGLKWGPKLKLCWLIWFSTNMTNVLWNFEYCSLKFFFQNFTTSHPPRTQMGPQTQIFLTDLIFDKHDQRSLKFWTLAWKTKFLKFWPFCPPPQDSNGTPNQNFVDWSDFQLTWPTFYEIFNTLAWKTKFLKFWFIGAGAPRKGP